MAKKNTTPAPAVKPPWAMTEAEQEAAALIEAEPEVAAAEAPERPKSKYTFGKLHEIVCPYDERVTVSFHVGTPWGTLQSPVKDDDDKGTLRRVRLIAPYWDGLDKIVDPRSEETLTNPDPDDLDSYFVITRTLYHLWGEDFFTWVLRTGWGQAIEEAGGTTRGN